MRSVSEEYKVGMKSDEYKYILNFELFSLMLRVLSFVLLIGVFIIVNVCVNPETSNVSVPVSSVIAVNEYSPDSEILPVQVSVLPDAEHVRLFEFVNSAVYVVFPSSLSTVISTDVIGVHVSVVPSVIVIAVGLIVFCVSGNFTIMFALLIADSLQGSLYLIVYSFPCSMSGI